MDDQHTQERHLNLVTEVTINISTWGESGRPHWIHVVAQARATHTSGMVGFDKETKQCGRANTSLENKFQFHLEHPNWR
eukprot:12343698-Prorocentrum_lima.AAC.1